MAVEITEAPYCRMESQKLGTTDEQYKAGLRAIENALRPEAQEGREWRIIDVTVDDNYYPWIRAKSLMSTARGIFEVISATEVRVHVILSRDSHTYGEVEDLWKKHRRARPKKA